MTATIAITGPTGAGKSRICRVLAERGAAVVEADRVGHEVLDDPSIRASVVDAFGTGILSDDGRIDRAALGPRVFADEQSRQRLDALVHPALAEACTGALARAAAAGSPLVILEAAVYFLLPGPPPVDLTVTVTAPESVRLARLQELGLALDPARDRMAAQAHLEPLWRQADRIIVNAGTEVDLAAAADALWSELVAPGGA